MKVLVTGADGFIGQYCLPLLLEKGFEVHGLSRKNKSDHKINWHQIDLLKESPAQLISKIKPTHLLHLAWNTEHGKFWTSKENPKWVRASVNLAQAFQKVGGQRFVSAGSCTEYEWNNEICVEGETPERPATLYGKSKKEFTDYLSKTFPAMSATGRIFHLYGPGEPETRLVPWIILSILKNEPVKCSDGLQIRDFVFVKDVASAFVTLLTSGVNGIVNIGSNKPLKLQELTKTISTLMNSNIEIQFGAVPRPHGDPDMLLASTKRLNNELRWYPQTPLEEGLELTINWIRSMVFQK